VYRDLSLDLIFFIRTGFVSLIWHLVIAAEVQKHQLPEIGVGDG
jgi:hypothetical protein